MDVVCTAGHVDHGKSTLVRALTGMEPDRFAEERRRGLTIDIGFGWTQLRTAGAPRTVAFVDLPGHERFIANMLAGAGPVEATLFVVAADEGWKPQSQEHLEILDLLEVSTGVVALTKADSTDEERLAATHQDVRQRLAGTSLAAAPIVAVSAVTGAGMADLSTALVEQLAQRHAPADVGLPRLWVDRVFTIKGAGTVVTGTLTGGALHTGDEVAVAPGERRARIRGLQSLKASVESAQPGDRVAVNLAGIDRAHIERGDVITSPGAHLTSTMDVWVRTVAGGEIRRRGAWHLHLGSGEWLVQVRPIGTGTISGEGHVRLVLSRPAPVVPGDRFVLRDAGARATVAGGLIVDAAPAESRTLRGTTAMDELRDAARRGNTTLLLSRHVADRGAAPLREAAAAVGLPAGAAEEAAASAKLLSLGASVADPRTAARWAAAISAALSEHHAAHPVDRGAPRATAIEAAARAGCPGELAPALLDVLLRLGRVATAGAGVRLPDHTVRLSPDQEQAKQALLTALEERMFAPPGLAAAAQRARVTPALLRELETDGTIVRVAPDIAISGRAVPTAQTLLRAAFTKDGPLTTSRAKEILGTTRKYAVPLLELLDRRGITRRRGDVRDVL